METILETKNLTKKYSDFLALDNLNLHLRSGAIYGLIGKNGAGKTTLIRIITGLQRPTDGNYILYGVDNNSQDIYKVKRRINAIVESPALYNNMTARDNLIMECKISGITNFNHIENILKIVNLTNTGKKKIKNFSFGMKARLAIAMCLVTNPDLIILDEPINGLDPQGIIEVRELILNLNREKNITFLISSHYLDELSKIATDYGFMKDGKMIEEITRDNLAKKLKKRIELEVSNTTLASVYLEKKKYDYEVIDDKTIYIYSKVKITDLVLELKKSNTQVFNIHEVKETLENYFINLVGGDNNE